MGNRHSSALFEEGLALYEQRNFDAAVAKLLEAAEAGNTNAMHLLGLCYTKGDGVGKSATTAAEWCHRAAEAGHVDAMFRVAICYANGIGVEKSAARAATWYQRAAEAGDAAAMFCLGDCYFNGSGVEENKGIALEWYRRAADKGDARATNAIGACYGSGHGVEKSATTAAEWYRRAADLGYPHAMYNLGLFHFYDEGNATVGLQWYRRAADAGHTDAMNALAMCFLNGDGVERSARTAADWLRRGAEMGDVGAMSLLGAIHTSVDLSDKSAEMAVGWLQRAAEAGDSSAMLLLSKRYADGDGVEKSAKEAVGWLHRAGESGLPRAMLLLGGLFKNGGEVQRNLVTAFGWYRRAAEAGDAAAMNELGGCYSSGVGVQPSATAATAWWRRGSEAGDAHAMLNFGMSCATGFGVEKSEATAVEWFRRSTDQNCALAMFNLAQCLINRNGPPNVAAARDLLTRLCRHNDVEQVWQWVDDCLLYDGVLPSGSMAATVRLLLECKKDESRPLASMQFGAHLSASSRPRLSSRQRWCLKRFVDLILGGEAASPEPAVFATALPLLVHDQVVPMELYEAVKSLVDARVQALPVKSFLPILRVAEALERATFSLVGKASQGVRDRLYACICGAIYEHVVTCAISHDLQNDSAVEAALLFVGIVFQGEFFGRPPSLEPIETVVTLQCAIDRRLAEDDMLRAKCVRMTLRDLKQRLLMAAPVVYQPCGACGKATENRCSGCLGAFFCSRECQVETWSEHKNVCKPKKGHK